MKTRDPDLENSERMEALAKSIDLLEEVEKHLLHSFNNQNCEPAHDSLIKGLMEIKGSAAVDGQRELKEHLEEITKGMAELPSTAHSELFTRKIDSYLFNLESARSLLVTSGLFDLVESTMDSKPNAYSEPSAMAFSKVDLGGPNPLVVVDDEPEILEIMREILLETGYDVITFSDPREALRELVKLGPMCVFTDYEMPKLNGIDFIKEIRKKDDISPIVLVSAYLSKSALVEAINLGVDSAIEKPFTSKQLIAKTLQMIGSLKKRLLTYSAASGLLLHSLSLEDIKSDNQISKRKKWLRAQTSDYLRLKAKHFRLLAPGPN
ncbi:MAG: hypothetical protein COT74_03230 [Bdellovibrionales bacterium CG10_big_fil_rev_8_21_14_0_10_45_34]|nr:MAG: hypothetical protein COT74_03230 [Bdellovibrionales bacterium CG10_big_fil_rev_8_21_14_0_10_45_34]